MFAIDEAAITGDFSTASALGSSRVVESIPFCERTLSPDVLSPRTLNCPCESAMFFGEATAHALTARGFNPILITYEKIDL